MLHTVQPIRSCDIFKCSQKYRKLWRTRLRTFSGTVLHSNALKIWKDLHKTERSQECLMNTEPNVSSQELYLDFLSPPLQKHVRKVVGGFGKESCVSTGVRKPRNRCASPTAMI